MSFNPSNRPERSTAGDAGPSPTVTHYQEVAERVDAIISEVLALLPKLEVPHPTTVQFVRTHKGIPPAFMETAIAGVAAKEDLRNTRKLDVTTGRDTLQLNQAIRPMADKLYHFAKSVQYTLDTRMAVLGAESLQIYYLAKGMARDPKGADMLELVADLKRDLGRSSSVPPKKKSEQDPVSETTPATEPSAPVQPKRRKKKLAVVTSL
jgi:hypothetical protein